MVTGELPFRSSGPLDAWMKKLQNDLTPPRRLVPTLSERLDWAITRAMSADREHRPASCREFVEDLTGHSTRRMSTMTDSVAVTQDLWYLVYKDENDTLHTVKGSTSAIRRSLREGLLGDAENIRAGRTKAGPFEPLRDYPEFRDILVTPAVLNVAAAVAAASTADESASVLAPRVQHATRPNAKVLALQPKAAPTIDLKQPPPSAEPSYEWVKWLLLVLLALSSAGIAFLLINLR